MKRRRRTYRLRRCLQEHVSFILNSNSSTRSCWLWSCSLPLFWTFSLSTLQRLREGVSATESGEIQLRHSVAESICQMQLQNEVAVFSCRMEKKYSVTEWRRSTQLQNGEEDDCSLQWIPKLEVEKIAELLEVKKIAELFEVKKLKCYIEEGKVITELGSAGNLVRVGKFC